MSVPTAQANAVAHSQANAVAHDRATTGLGVLGTCVFVVLTIGAVVTVFAAFIALLMGGSGGARGLFALTVGLLAYATLSLVQFIHWAALLLRALRGRS